MFSQTKICFTQSQLYQIMAKIRLSRIKSCAFKILSYAGPSVPNTGIPLDVLALYRQEVMDICKDRAYMGIWQIFQTANVLNQPIHSVYPNIGNTNVIKDLNRTVYCLDRTRNTLPCVNIMWTPMQVKRTRPCHFVPLLKVVRWKSTNM